MLFQCTELRQLLGLHISYPPWKKRVVGFFFFFPLFLSFSLCTDSPLQTHCELERKKEKKSASYVNKKEGSEAWLMPIPPVGNFSSNFKLIGIFFLLQKQLRKCRCPDHRNLCMYMCWLLNGVKATDAQHRAEQKVCSTCNWFLGECARNVSLSSWRLVGVGNQTGEDAGVKTQLFVLLIRLMWSIYMSKRSCFSVVAQR